MTLTVALEPEFWNPKWDTEPAGSEEEGFERLAIWERTHPREAMEIVRKLNLKNEERMK